MGKIGKKIEEYGKEALTFIGDTLTGGAITQAETAEEQKKQLKKQQKRQEEAQKKIEAETEFTEETAKEQSLVAQEQAEAKAVDTYVAKPEAFTGALKKVDEKDKLKKALSRR